MVDDIPDANTVDEIAGMVTVRDDPFIFT